MARFPENEELTKSVDALLPSVREIIDGYARGL